MDSSFPSEEVPPKAHKNYKEIISTLPKAAEWPLPIFHYQGFWCLPGFLEGIMSAQEHFNPQPTDILLSTTPKSGTTWLKALTFAILTRSRFDDSTNPLLTKNPHECIPILEVDLAKNSRNREYHEIPLVATHIPYPSLPKSIIASGCKIVYLCRDPKDVLISMWHFIHKVTEGGKELPSSKEPLPLEKAFELFCEGVSVYGPYWDHVLGYWRASLESPERILFLKYEDLRNETIFYVKKLAEFMGLPFSLEEERNGVVQKIVELCSFENLSNLEVNRSGNFRPDRLLKIENDAYFRKGKIGDWENYLSAEMTKRIDQVTDHKLRGSGLMFHASNKA